MLMRKARTITAGVFFAVVILLGAAAPAVAALLCDAGFGPASCPMKARPAPKPKSCCDKTPAPERNQHGPSGCDCALKAGQQPASISKVATCLPAPILTILAPIARDGQLTAFTGRGVDIYTYSDGSPPSVPLDSGRGRAPPRA